MKVASPGSGGKVRFLHPEFSLQQRVAEAAAVVADPRRGKVVELARRHGVSRQTASALVGKVRRACADILAPRPPGRTCRIKTVVVDPERIAESVVALAVEAHASNAGTQACLQTMLDVHVATGRISAILKDAGKCATERLQTLPMPAQAVFAATDELYDHGRPVLALMEDEHLGVLFAGKEHEADGTTWGVRLLELQERGLRCAHLVKDQGTAMTAGVAESGLLPRSACGSDAFHFLRAFGREARALAHQSTRAQDAHDKLEAALAYHTAPSHGRGRPRQPTTIEAYERAAASAAAAAAVAAGVQILFHETRALLQPVDPDGRLIPAAAAQADLETVAALLRELGPHTRPLATLIAGAGPALHAFRAPLAQRHADLCLRHGADLVQFVAWTWVHRQQLHEHLPRTPDELRQGWDIDAPLSAVAEIWHACRNCHRSSSVLESFNSILRLHVQAHRGLTPSLLPLIVYRHNMRPFPRGVHRGEAPFVALGILPPDPRSWVQQLLRSGPATPPVPALPIPPALDSPQAQVSHPASTSVDAAEPQEHVA